MTNIVRRRRVLLQILAPRYKYQNLPIRGRHRSAHFEREIASGLQLNSVLMAHITSDYLLRNSSNILVQQINVDFS